MSTPPPTPSDAAEGTAAHRGPGVSRRAVAAVLAVATILAAAVVGGALLVVGGGPSPSASGPGEARELGPGASADGYAVWERNDDGEPVRWDPCAPIDLVVAAEGAPPGGVGDLEEAVRRIGDATGLELRVVGTTDERPHADRPPYQPDRYGERWAPVLVAWAAPHEGGIRLRSTDRGLAVPIAVGTPGDRVYVTAQLALNADRTDLVAGFEDRSRSWGATLLHELGHVVGLDHVDDPDELMAVHPGSGAVAFGPGDRAGLAAVGSDLGCRPAPRPQHVEVADAPG